MGGLGGIVSEIVAYNGLAAKVYPIGLNDIFSEGYGTYAVVRKRNSLDSESIYMKIREEVANG